MTVPYTQVILNDRLSAVLSLIDSSGNGYILIREGSTTLATVQLQRPSATVANGTMTFVGTLMDPAASVSGDANNAVVTSVDGSTVIYGLTVVSCLGNGDIVMFNNINSTVITAGQSLQITSASIIGA